MPQRASLTSIHSGVGALESKPRTSRSTNRSQPVGSAMVAGHGVRGVAAAASAYSVDNSCWQYQLVQTPRGYYKRVLINVCQ